MGTVTNLNPAKDTGEFCDFLFGVEDGFVYIPTKDPETGAWFDAWFSWPKQRESAVNHIQTLSKTREVYIGPAIYSSPQLTATYIKGASVVWAEFDGAVPTANLLEKKGSPLPTVRVRSSKPGHEHWYWKLDKFSTDLKTLQETNKSLAYALDADPSGWDIEQVLRPVGSFNHKRDYAPVGLVSNSFKFNSLKDFTELPSVEENYSESDFDASAIPDHNRVLLTYAWQSSEIEIIRSKAIEGQRSSMLTKLGYICCEKGLDNSEIYSILEFVDSRWGKFANRTNKKHCYIKLIDYVRQKYPYKSEPLTETATGYRLQGFLSHFNNTDRVKWIIEGLLHDTAIMYFVGKAGSLKTALAMELGVNLALNRSILSWKANIERPLRMIMWSLEMSGPELVVRQEKMVARYNDEELATLEENFVIYSDPDPVRLYDLGDAENFKSAILDYKPDGIIIDSASYAFAMNMSDEEAVKKAVKFLQRMRHLHKFFAIIIHHPRKDPAGVRNQKMSLNDLFGSQALENSATTVIGMSLKEKKGNEAQRIEFMHLKTRFAEKPADYDIELNSEDFTFSRPVITLGSTDVMDINKLAEEIATKSRKPKPGDEDGPGLTF